MKLFLKNILNRTLFFYFMRVKPTNCTAYHLSGKIGFEFPMNFLPHEVEADNLHDKCNDP